MTDPRTNQRRPPRGGSDVEQRGRDERRRGAIDETDTGGFPPDSTESPARAPADPAVNSDPSRRSRRKA
jgi:hypothetical protein